MGEYLEYAARGKTGWWRYPVAIVLALVIAIVTGVVLSIVLILARVLNGAVAREFVQPSHPLVFFTANGVIFGVVLLGFTAAIALVHRKRFGDVVGRWCWRLFLAGAAIWTGVQVALALIDMLIDPRGFKITASPEMAVVAIPAFLALAIQTFAEEFVFRGYLTQAFLLASKRPLLAAVASGLLFGALHIPNGVTQAIYAVFFGVVTALIAIRTGGIAFTFGLHLVNNLFGAMIVVSASDVFQGSPALITQNTPHLVWWDLGWALAAVLLAGALVIRPRPREASP